MRMRYSSSSCSSPAGRNTTQSRSEEAGGRDVDGFSSLVGRGRGNDGSSIGMNLRLQEILGHGLVYGNGKERVPIFDLIPVR